MNELRLFLQEHADKADTYEIWGGSKRPTNGGVMTMGNLRDIYRSQGRGSFSDDHTPLPIPAGWRQDEGPTST